MLLITKTKEGCSHLLWDHDVRKDEGGGHVHGGFLVFRFVPVSLLMFLIEIGGEGTENR